MAPKKESLNLTIKIDGAKATLAAFKNLPKEANDALRDAALELSELMAGWLRSAGASEGRQAALLVGTIKAKRDRLPYVVVGGSAPLGRHGTPAFNLLFGSEFGSSGQGGFGKGSNIFAPWGYKARTGGNSGHWIFPTIKAEEDTISRKWTEAADEVVKRFSSGKPDVGGAL